VGVPLVGREQAKFLRPLASGQEEEGLEAQRRQIPTLTGKELRPPAMRAVDKVALAPLCVQE
jgi:hypothetical protein